MTMLTVNLFTFDFSRPGTREHRFYDVEIGTCTSHVKMNI